MKKIVTRLLALVLMVLGMQNLQAQDIHFSQFYSAPLTLNPAMTGNSNGLYRAAVTYRNQWSSIPAPYSTVMASFEYSPLACQLGIDNLGIGLVIFNDVAGDGQLNTFNGALSLAYHKGLDAESRFRISLGGQVAYTTKSVNVDNLLFSTQIEDFQFNPLLPNGEPIQDQNFSYIDFNAGGMFTAAVSERANFYIGGAYFHPTEPEETFLVSNLTPAGEKTLDPRLVGHLGGSFFVSDNISISPSALYMQQSGSTETILGAAFGYHMAQDNRYRRGSSASDGTGIYVGGWYRMGDAIVILIGADYQSIRFGFSYDINISELDVASNNQGGLELSLMYTGPSPECKKRSKLYCPRF